MPEEPSRRGNLIKAAAPATSFARKRDGGAGTRLNLLLLAVMRTQGRHENGVHRLDNESPIQAV
jgi:hypothetical protein